MIGITTPRTMFSSGGSGEIIEGILGDTVSEEKTNTQTNYNILAVLRPRSDKKWM
jgi:hypothetical protein